MNKNKLHTTLCKNALKRILHEPLCATETSNMKAFTIVLILISNSIFGQEIIIGSPVDSTFKNFSNTVFSLKRSELKIRIKPLNILELQDERADSIIKFELKYIHTIGNPPSFDEIENYLITNRSNYWCAFFGTEYLVIGLSRNTGSMNDVKYYYRTTK